jgi:hypothetical protein
MAPTADVLFPPPSGVPFQYYSNSIREKFESQIVSRPQLPNLVTEYADIEYAFDEKKYLERSNSRLRAGGLTTSLPYGWPSSVQGPLVWTGSDFPVESSFVYSLSSSDKDEVMAALNHFKGK